MKRRKIIAAAFAGVMLSLTIPTAAFANHDCGPPDKHNDHAKTQEDRNRPCQNL